MSKSITITDIYERLRNVLAPDYKNPVSDDHKIDQFLKKMKESRDVNSVRLLISLGIDVNNYHNARVNAPDRNDFLQLVRKVILTTGAITRLPKTFPEGEIPPALLFASALENFAPEKLRPNISSVISDTYVRICNFESFIKYIYMRNAELNTDYPSAIDPTRLARLYSDFEKGRKFRNVKITKLSTKKGWVFLARRADIEDLIAKRDVRELLDNLGFYLQGIHPDHRYMTFEYPETFTMPSYQPTSLTCDWGEASENQIGFGNEFYMSYKLDDDWGRTFSVSGKAARVKERIHLPIDNADDDCLEFGATPLGGFSDILDKADLLAIINEAIVRYSDSIS